MRILPIRYLAAAAIILSMALCQAPSGVCAETSCKVVKDEGNANDTAYLLVYFTDPTHDLFMATSDDGYKFT